MAAIAPLSADFAIKNDKYVVDAKSIMGVFSMDLSRSLKLQIDTEGDRMDDILKEIKEFIIQ